MVAPFHVQEFNHGHSDRFEGGSEDTRMLLILCRSLFFHSEARVPRNTHTIQSETAEDNKLHSSRREGSTNRYEHPDP